MSDQHSTTESIMMSALSTLTSSQLTSLSLSLSTTFHRHHRHLISLLSSPTLFTHTLNHLYSISLPQKSLLIARHLLSFLRPLRRTYPLLHPQHYPPPPPTRSAYLILTPSSSSYFFVKSANTTQRS